MKVYIIDNYDSFTYNLYQYIGETLETARNQGKVESFEVLVKRNNEVTLADIKAAQPDRIIISPGPGSPDDPAYFGVCAEVIAELGKTIPVLGVCLGMQGICHVFGGDVVKAKVPMHGKISPIVHSGESVFKNVPNPLDIMRYHSLVAKPETLPACLKVTAVTGDFAVADFDDHNKVTAGGDFEIQGVVHRDYPIHGIQFHPESFATEAGKELVSNFLFTC
ncbi:anthranilate synthase component II [Salinibius halmophilus]|uniref:anthranilate synthase component II n=1 Tax=Salinibius halmophilus TaxID=1853216 RepID=UPI000E668D09|nr:aminodeoxychorismate/anthranilate synthase component II [Salinibius halmophilus]